MSRVAEFLILWMLIICAGTELGLGEWVASAWATLAALLFWQTCMYRRRISALEQNIIDSVQRLIAVRNYMKAKRDEKS